MKRPILVAMVAAFATACGSDPVSSNGIAAVQITTQSGALRPGQATQFTATPVNAYGNAISGAGTVTWSSALPAVASVSTAGLVTALTAGSTSITATIQGVQGTRVVTVVPIGTGAIVTMPGNSFIPFEVTVRAGEPVYFEFPQEAHNVIFDRVTGAPADIQQTRNATVARTFPVTGQFLYDCTLHPGMTGAVRVNP